MSADARGGDERTPLDDALDLFVYAPVGLALTAAEELPRIVERGRDVLGSRVDLARVLGRVAINQGRVELSRIASQWNDLNTIFRSGVVNPPSKRRDDAPAPLHDAAPAPTPAVAAPASPRAAKRAPAAPATLGIPGYESLSASQVVARLDGLTSAQLDAVKQYESTTRRRRTILGRISQIESGSVS